MQVKASDTAPSASTSKAKRSSSRARSKRGSTEVSESEEGSDDEGIAQRRGRSVRRSGRERATVDYRVRPHAFFGTQQRERFRALVSVRTMA